VGTAIPGQDVLGWRCKFGVIAPSTNTVVQPDYECLKVAGVTNHHSRAVIPDLPVHSDSDFLALMDAVRAATLEAVDGVMTCLPDHIVIGMSAETFWDGVDGADAFSASLRARTGVEISLGSSAVIEALEALGGAARIGVITPYMPVGDERVRVFFEQSGVTVVTLEGLKCSSPVNIAHVTESRLRAAIAQVDGPGIEAIVQVGTNISMLRLAAAAELELKKPVIAINAATYWHALRHRGIRDRLTGFGRLLEEF